MSKHLVNKFIYFGLILLIFFISINLRAEEKHSPSSSNAVTPPPANGLSKKWRVGFYEGGQHSDYLIIFKSTINALMTMGWLEKKELPQIEDHKRFWQWVSQNVKSSYIEFVPDAFYSAQFDRQLRAEIQKEAIDRFNYKGDVDLVLAFGTWAGLDLANDKHHINTLVTSSSDPIAAGMVPSAYNSGYGHIHAHVDPGRYTRQVELFYRIIGFDKLGIVYENSLEGRSYASVGGIETLAEKLGFTLVPCHVATSNVSPEEATKNLIACHEKLAKEVTAVYVTSPIGVPSGKMDAILEPLIRGKIYTFSQSGSRDVQAGALLSIEERSDLMYTGRFYASNIAKVLNGANPGDLTQVYVAPSRMAINLKTARYINYTPPTDILEIIDDFYGDAE